MSRVDTLREARTSYAVKFREFASIAAKQPSCTVLFFEGEDVKYFGPRIQLLRQELNWCPVNCGGRDIVLRLQQLIAGHEVYGQIHVAFFIDSDFHPPSAPTQTLYVTPCYSVENLYVNETVIKRVLVAEFGVHGLGDDEALFSALVELFNQRLSEFLQAVELLNAWIYFYRKKEAEEKSKSRLNLASINIANLISITLTDIKTKYTLFDLETTVDEPLGVTQDIVDHIIKEFHKTEKAKTFRGKYQAYFMRIFLTKLAEDANSETPVIFHKKQRTPYRISERNFLTDLGMYADTPPCCSKFISRLS